MENGNQPATKQDVQNAKNELRDELVEVIRLSETRLLQAFYGYAESNRKRMIQ